MGANTAGVGVCFLSKKAVVPNDQGSRAERVEVPCVATAVGAIPQLLADGAGLLVPPEDPQALTAEPSGLLSDPALAESVAKAGRSRVLAEYELKRVVDAYLRLFQEVFA
jgi:glycosyltransferase involved in cell wall biosynthesis